MWILDPEVNMGLELYFPVYQSPIFNYKTLKDMVQSLESTTIYIKIILTNCLVFQSPR